MRAYRGQAFVTSANAPQSFRPRAWRGESRLALPELGGALRFRRARGQGIDAGLIQERSLTVRLRSGGERLQTDARRPRRTLKNLFQEAGVPPWAREQLPLLFCGDDLVWAPGLGIDAKFASAGQSVGIVPVWRVQIS